MEGMPEGDDPIPGDIGWYAPWGNVVLYYGDVGYSGGIARIGRLGEDVDLTEIAAIKDGFPTTLELAP